MTINYRVIYSHLIKNASEEKEASFLYPHDPNHDDYDPHHGECPKWENLLKIGGNPGGFNDGGMYRDSKTGEDWYVKFPPHDDVAKNEALAAKLYRASKVRYPETWTIETPNGLAVASRIVKGIKIDGDALSSGKVKGVAEGFGADAWLANWDQVGIGDTKYSNMQVRDGHVVRIDPGGALLYRGTGGPKGPYFDEEVSEVDKFRNGNNYYQTSVYQHVSDKEAADSILKVLRVTDDQIEDLVSKYGPGSDSTKKALIDKLKKRQESLSKHYKRLTGKEPSLT